MTVVIANPPWIVEKDGIKRYGIRASSRWPHLRNNKVTVFPIYHAYSAAVLEREGIKVAGIDAVDEELSIAEFAARIKELAPEYVFLETSYPSYSFDKETIKELKKQVNSKIIIFGPDATVRGEFLLKDCKDIDIAIAGEFDYTILDIASGKKLDKIDGICYRDKGKIKRTKPRKFIENLDSLPFPAREFYSIKSYQEPINYRPQFLISTSRGCPYGCSFCVYPQTISGRGFRKRSVKNVVDEIEFLVNKYKAKVINFEDDTFTVDTARVKEICNELIKRKINVFWQCYSSVNIQDFEMYCLMKKAGCEMIRFGVESASLSAQKHSSKDLDVEKIKNGFSMARKAGMKTFGTFTFGLPGETKESMQETIKLAIELNPYAVQFSYIVPFPGTRLYEEAKKNGWLINENPDGMEGCFKPAIIPEGLEKNDIEGIVPMAYKKFYLRPSYAISQVIKARSVQDFKRLIYGGFSLFKRLA